MFRIQNLKRSEEMDGASGRIQLVLNNMNLNWTQPVRTQNLLQHLSDCKRKTVESKIRIILRREFFLKEVCRWATLSARLTKSTPFANQGHDLITKCSFQTKGHFGCWALTWVVVSKFEDRKRVEWNRISSLDEEHWASWKMAKCAEE